MTNGIGYHPADLAMLAEIEPRHFWFRARRRIIVDALARWFGDARSYLEIGCGTGFNARGVAHAFPGWSVTMSDPLAPAAGHIRRIDALRIPFENKFDIVGAYDVLEHIEDDRAALVQFRKACRPHGGILLTVPQHRWLWSPADTFAQHFRRYERRPLLRMLNECGFEALGWSSFLTVNLPAIFLRNRFLRASGRNPAWKTPIRPVNWLLEQGLEADRRLIRAGWRLPAGGSLLVAARRSHP